MSSYTRTIQIEGITYKQISSTQWQNISTGQIIDNTRFATIINQFKSKKVVVPVTPSGGPTGACCEVISGILQCSQKTEEACSGGCFKGAGTNCFVTEEDPDPCDTCVYCCYIGAGCFAKTPVACVGSGGGTYFNKALGCTACKYGVCSSDSTVVERFYGNGCTGIFIEGGGPASFDQGVYCTGSGIGQTCAGIGFRYQQSTNIFIEGATCSSCILGACCTGGTCLGQGLTSQAACSVAGGLFFAGKTCSGCDFGIYCTGSGINRTCIETGYRGQEVSNEFQQGATCAYCTMGTCCVNGEPIVGIRQVNCTGTFFPGIFDVNACNTGSCCLGATCSENVFRYNCSGIFNNGLTCIACSNGACCLPGGGCTLTTMGSCMATGGTFFGGATCSACDVGSCCNGSICTDQRRGNICTGTFYAGTNCATTPCELGSCCTNGSCISNTNAINCINLNGSFFAGQTCAACATGANCLTDLELNGDRVCAPNTFFGNFFEGSFYPSQGCSACQSGVCCNQSGGGNLGIRGDCTAAGASFFGGQTLFICDAGVFCTGSGVGQTCFGLGYRGQSLTNNFIAGATCSSCILGACCTGGTCLNGGLTSQAACNSVGGLFYAGVTCRACDFGVYCTGSTCFGLGFRGQSLTNNFIAGATCSSCILGACCTGGTCSGGGQTSQAACNGLFFAGATCRACDYGIYCTGATCLDFGYRNQVLTNNFIVGATCSSCILGACCTGGTCLGGGQTSQAACLIAGGTFYVGATCFQCDMGIFCTGSGIGQTCFGSGHRGQSLTNNFITGATCSSCILGACCTGGTCLGGGLTSQAACSAVGGLFYAGTTCVSCDYGAYCTGSNETTSCIGLGYRAQNLSNQFIIQGNCNLDCLYGSCCDGITCLGITSARNCPSPYNFYSGSTCSACDTGLGACCTGGNSSITTSTVCASQGGVFFPQGSTALCVTGSCCTGGTCTQEITGRSGNCQLFIAGATCGICDTGVFCTGSTCFGTGFRGQSLTGNFIQGATCSSCILGPCCTGGTCLGGGLTAQTNCPPSVGTFIVGATSCNACGNKVNCCVSGNHSYVLRQECEALNGIIFEGQEDSLACELGVFCENNSCKGETLFGYNLSDTFIPGGTCDECIYGTCCDDIENPSFKNRVQCAGTFVPGPFNPNACGVQGATYGICCVNSVCSSEIEQSSCSGYFISNEIAAANNISCSTTPCELGVCCKETNVTSVTGGVCLGEMTRGECALTGGDFFSFASGATCTNCLYIPMLASAVFEWVGNNLTTTIAQTKLFDSSVTGFTGNEIQPFTRNAGSTTSSGNNDTWLRGGNFYGPGATSAVPSFQRRTNISGSQVFQQDNQNYAAGFSLWYDAGKTLFVPSVTFSDPGVIYDVPPAGLTSAISGGTYPLPFILSSNGNTSSYEVPKYIKVVFGYANTEDYWRGKSIVYRFTGSNPRTGTPSAQFALDDATKHAGLTLGTFNVFPNPTPYIASPSDVNSPGISYSSPVLIQLFAENPLKYRSRPVGSCCKGITCIGIVTQDHCASVGGTFNLDTQCTACYPQLVRGNCCTGGTFFGFTNESACNAIGGYFKAAKKEDRNICLFGTECSPTETCISPNIYRGQFTPSSGNSFVSFDYSRNLGCTVCNQGICCVGQTCNGYIPKVFCDDLSGTFYPNESSCEGVCVTGVCCDLTTPGCGTFTNAVSCKGINKLFLLGYTQGQTCSACLGLTTMNVNAAGTTFMFTFNKGVTNGKFQDGSLWVQEDADLRLHKVRVGIDDVSNTMYSKVVGGKEHTVALTYYDQTIYSFGTTLFGLNGTNYEDEYRTETNYVAKGYKDIAAGFYHTLAISTGGTVSAWGRNVYGESTVPAGLTGVIKIAAGEYHSLALRYDGGVTCWGLNTSGQCNVPSGLTGVTMISAGANHSLALRSDGTVVAWGDNTFGQTNVPVGLTGVVSIAAGYYHNIVSTSNFGITCWGRTAERQCAVPAGLTGTAVAAGGYHSLVMAPHLATEIVGFGRTADGQITFPYATDAVQMAAGEYHTILLSKDYFNLSSFGRNTSGQRNHQIYSVYSSNTQIKDIQVHSNGYKGSIYIHGVAKNPVPFNYIDPVSGFTTSNYQYYTSLCYEDYDSGWIGSQTSSATETASNYEGFKLNTFNENMNVFKTSGFTFVAGDVLLANASNFNPHKIQFPPNGSGYPYQMIKTRANTLSYGILNCLSATGAALAGSTLCFRPPVSWLQEARNTRPIYPMSRLEGKIPGQPGNTLIPVTTGNIDKAISYDTVQNYAIGYILNGEMGSGVNYGVVTPIWSMYGKTTKNASSYGEQYVVPINAVVQGMYGTGTPESSLTIDQRRDLVARIAQAGLDVYGAQRVFATSLSSGAGQKAGRSRGWAPLAGYFLGETAMYDPEATLLQDTARMNKFIQYFYTSNPSMVPGPLPSRSCVTDADWHKFRNGDTGSAGNTAGLRRMLAKQMSHEVNTMVELANDPSNLLRHYEYIGVHYRQTNFSGFTTSGPTGITFYDEFNVERGINTYDQTKVRGDFGVMRWGSTVTWGNPFAGRFSYDTKSGRDAAWQGGWLRVESGPGSSGPGGATASRFYKVIDSTGFRSDSSPAPASLGGGYQLVIGQTWADGIPNHTSVLKFYPAISVDAGITRPSSFEPSGFTYSPVFFIINNQPGDPCGITATANLDSLLWDATLFSQADYFTNSLDAWAPQYLAADYIRRTKNVPIVSDIAPMPDYIRQYVYTSPYNILSLYAWYTGTSSVYNAWLGTTWSNDTLAASRINFKDHFPGVKTWRGITVG